jgi:hypothetical protein
MLSKWDVHAVVTFSVDVQGGTIRGSSSIFRFCHLNDRNSTVIGCPGVITILSHELAMTGSPAEVLSPSFLAGFVVRKSYCRFCGEEILLYFSLGSPPASSCCCELAATTFYETSRIITIKEAT